MPRREGLLNIIVDWKGTLYQVLHLYVVPHTQTVPGLALPPPLSSPSSSSSSSSSSLGDDISELSTRPQSICPFPVHVRRLVPSRRGSPSFLPRTHTRSSFGSCLPVRGGGEEGEKKKKNLGAFSFFLFGVCLLSPLSIYISR